jgi:NAD(P)-dependent dehydrogenase (short-subunit alcohol dehydrogenase family)
MKNVLITGASRGVGFALAAKFLAEGDRVFCASRNLNPLKKLAELYKDRCILVALDLEKEESIQSAVDTVSAKSEKLDVVINNAGALVNKEYATITKKELQMCYDVNVLGPYQLIQYLLPHLQKDAHVVFISSMGGFQGTQKFAGLTAYSSSKAAVASLTECLQEEFKETQLAFNCLCLGAIQTEMLQNAFPGYQAPLDPEQISVYIYQFSTTANQFLKGKVIPVSLSTP